jgi:hypothetical protein
MTALKQKEAREHLMFGWFAEIPSPSVAMIAREQQFAEKVHAFTVPRPSPNSRVRDLVDLHLLIASGSLDASRCTEALRRTFERRNTHEFPKSWYLRQRIGIGLFGFSQKSAVLTSDTHTFPGRHPRAAVDHGSVQISFRGETAGGFSYWARDGRYESVQLTSERNSAPNPGGKWTTTRDADTEGGFKRRASIE